MSEKSKLSLKEKELLLQEKIEKTKKELARLQEKRRLELGKLACKHGLDTYDNAILDKQFANVSKVLADGNV